MCGTWPSSFLSLLMDEESPGLSLDYDVRERYNFDIEPLGLVSSEGKLRVTCIKIVENPWLERFIFTIIILNAISIALAVSSLVDDHPGAETALEIFEIVCLSIFTMEMFIKVTAMGLVRGNKTYLRNPWNILDFIVVILGWLTFVPGISSFTPIRMLRLLRPLSTISRIPSLRRIVRAIIVSIPELFDVSILIFLLMLIFGCAGL